MNFTGHYDDWRKTRFETIVNLYGKEYFHNKMILELGAGEGDLGNMFSELGASITCIEAREENILNGKKKYSHLNFIQRDLEKNFTDLLGFDIILHTGVFYHLANPKEHLQYLFRIIKKDLIFETEVVDSLENEIITEPNFVYDQSFSGIGNRCSEVWIEKQFEKEHLNYKMIKESSLNSDFHVYDWKFTNGGYRNNGIRRFWIVSK